MESNQDIKYINTMLDIEQYSGETPTRIGPFIAYLLLAFGPMLLYAYLFLGIIPLKYAAVFFIIHLVRTTMVIVGEESKRVEQYKQQIYDEYSSITDINNIVTFYKDGLLEYKGNKVSYILVAHSKDDVEVQYKSRQISRMLSGFDTQYMVDIRCQNILDKDELHSRYEGVSMFPDREVAKDYLEIIDYNRDIVKDDTLITRVVFTISARKRNFKSLRTDIERVLNSQDTRAFKTIAIADREMVKEIIARDVDTYIDFDEIMRKKHSKEEFYGSYVEAYDYEEKNTVAVKVKEERGFMSR